MPADAFMDDELIAPLSFAQQRLWLLDQLLPAGSVYNVGKVVWLVGVLSVEALRGALNEVVRRHEVLRTRFAVEEGEPVQVIAPEFEVELTVEDLRALAEGAREAEAGRRAQAEAQAPFDLERGPLIRVRLLRLGEEEHWLLLTLHHIVTDGWSSGVLGRELSVLYAAYRRGEASPLAELPVQYADYAVWQRGWLQGEVLARQLAYWKPALAELPVLELPTDRPRPGVASYGGGRVAFELGEELTQGLKALGRREGTTLFMTLLAAFQVLLYRYSGQEDIAVGVPIAGRMRPELEGLIGFFVNTLVMRGDLSGAPSFQEYLGRVRARALEAYANQDLPFEKLVEELAPKRDLSRNPLFQVSLALQNTPPGELQLEGLEVQRVDVGGSGSAKFDLTLNLTETAGRLRGSVEYAIDLFEASTIARLVGHWRVLLAGIVADPGQAIARLPLLTPEERQQLLVEWNATAVDYPRDQCIQQLFEQQVERTPAAVAVVFAEQTLSYGALNARANQLAHHLRTLGVGPEVLVGLCVERSLELVVGMLGILKAGGAYVPLDPSYPAERLAFMLADTQAPVLLTQQPLLPHLPAHAGRTLCLDRDWASIAVQPETNPACTATATNLAYVIYTSGSTGQPKGVMIEQHSMVNYVLWFLRDFRLTRRDRVLQITPTSFDISILELISPLLAGARMEIAAPGAHRLVKELVDLMQRRAITILQVVPSMLGAIVEGPGFARLDSLRHVFSAGEALGAELVRRFHQQTAAKLINGYGPTETTVYSTFWICDRNDAPSVIPIGRPLSNTRIWILDAEEVPVPVGVVGEIYIAGEGVGRGYRGRPDLTRERFVADPFARNANERMYRTGDLARYLPDGNINVLGRRDDQIKLHGFRIELGEIEAALARHNGVARNVVTVREYAPSDRRLVAYVVAREDRLTAADLLASLKQCLPDYMLPSAFVIMDALPLAPNGKVDRKRLPVPGRESFAEVEAQYVAPRDGIEEQLVAIFAEVLDLDRVGVHSDFFELGGHSLLAVRALSRVEAIFGVCIGARAFFGDATVANLAQILAQASGNVDAADHALRKMPSLASQIRRNPRVLVSRASGTRSTSND